MDIYFGREDIDKDAFLFAKIGERLDALKKNGPANGRVFLIVPDQFTLEAERNAFRYMDGSGFMEFEVVSLSRLGQRILSETGDDRRIPVGKNGRHMLLSAILREEAPFLESFPGIHAHSSFIEMLNNLISGMKLHNISPDDVQEVLEKTEQPVLKRKLRDVLRVYRRYEERICGKYVDSEDHLRVVVSRVPRSETVRAGEFWIQGFDYLTPGDLDVVQALLACARGLSIVLTAGVEAGGAGAGAAERERDRDLFRLTNRLIGKLRARAEAAGKTCRIFNLRDFAPGLPEPRKSPAVAHMEKELFSYPFRRWGKGAAPGLTLLRAANYYAEAESAAAEITRLVRDEHYRYRDILVICNDMEARASVIRRVFAEYELPVFMDRRKNLLHNPALEYIAALMDVVLNNWRTEDLLRLMKTGMSPVSPAQWELLDEYAAQHRVRGKSQWTKDFDRVSPYDRFETAAELAVQGGEDGAGQDGAAERLLAVNEARSLIAGHVTKFAEKIASDRGVTGKTRAFYLFLRDEARLPEKLETDVAALREQGCHLYADELSQVWTQIISVFDQMAAILEDERISRADYGNLLSAGLESIDIGLIPTSSDQILIGSMQRTRAGRVKALFVLGANDGVLPAAGRRAGLLTEDDLRHIAESGKEITKLEALQSEEEQLAMYRNLSRPSESVWLSYSVSDPDGKELRPSLVFEKLRKIFPGNFLKEDIRKDGRALDLIAAKGGALAHLGSALRDMKDGDPEGADWRQALEWFREHDSASARMLERGWRFSNRRERIARAYVERLYGTDRARGAGAADAESAVAAAGPEQGRPEQGRLDAPVSVCLSPSALERYARCPFSHFVTYGLQAKEWRVVEAGARERGDLFHRILMDFSESLTEKNIRVQDPASKWMRLTRTDCEKIVDQLFASLLDAPAEKDAAFAKIFRRGKAEEYRAARMRVTARTAAWMMAEQVQAGLIEAMFFEERFGQSRRIPPLVQEAGDGMRIRIEGQIDRMDILRGGRVKIVDYKSGAEKFDLQDVRAGRSLQLMLYLRAAVGSLFAAGGKPLKPAGAFYFKIAEPRFDCGAWKADAGTSPAEEKERALRKSFRLDGVVLDDQDVLRAIAGLQFDGPQYSPRRSSFILPVQAKEDANGETLLAGRSQRLLGEAAFSELQAAVDRKTAEFCENLAGGVIDAKPETAGGTDACAYCAYMGICGYDSLFGA
jgi:ATP-dependent helicase/nuclease subunit B